MQGNGFKIGKVECNKTAIISPSEMFDSAQALAGNKSCGVDCSSVEQLCLQVWSFYPTHFFFYWIFFSNGTPPDSLQPVLLVPVIKN